MKKTDIRKWVKALRSGKYKQSKGSLQVYGGFCCLGVACSVFVPSDKLRRHPNGDILGGTPREQEHSPKWLQTINYDFESYTGHKLSSLNDDGFFNPTIDLWATLNFDEIADLLEAVYILEVLNENK
jgi:hypothetical protein